MILAHVIAENKKQALEIIDLLLGKNLLLHAVVSEKTVYTKNKKTGQLESSKQTLIIGKTKALLFNTINQELKESFPKRMPMLYSIPIVYINEELANLLKTSTAKV